MLSRWRKGNKVTTEWRYGGLVLRSRESVKGILAYLGYENTRKRMSREPNVFGTSRPVAWSSAQPLTVLQDPTQTRWDYPSPEGLWDSFQHLLSQPNGSVYFSAGCLTGITFRLTVLDQGEETYGLSFHAENMFFSPRNEAELAERFGLRRTVTEIIISSPAPTRIEMIWDDLDYTRLHTQQWVTWLPINLLAETMTRAKILANHIPLDQIRIKVFADPQELAWMGNTESGVSVGFRIDPMISPHRIDKGGIGFSMIKTPWIPWLPRWTREVPPMVHYHLRPSTPAWRREDITGLEFLANSLSLLLKSGIWETQPGSGQMASVVAVPHG